MRVLQLTEQVLACTLLAAVQGVRIRIENGELNHDTLPKELLAMYDDICDFFQPLTEDRALDTLLRFTVDAIQTKRWSLYD